MNFSSKVRPLHQGLKSNLLPPSAGAIKAFDELRSSLINASLTCIRDDMPFRVDCNASEHTIAATFSQADRPVAFFSRTLSKSEVSYTIVEKEALAVIESVRYWSDFLHRSRFLLVTDQKALISMFCHSNRGKIKNTKL